MAFDLTCSAPDFMNADTVLPRRLPVGAMTFATRGQVNVPVRRSRSPRLSWTPRQGLSDSGDTTTSSISHSRCLWTTSRARILR